MNVNELPRFKHRATGEIVHAGKIAFMAKDDMRNTLMVHANPDNLTQIIEVPMNYLHCCHPVIGGYFVADAEDNLAYLHPSEFHIIYSSVDDEPEIDLQAADFSDALMWLKEGKRVQRAGWNGKGQYVFVVKPPQSAAPNEPKYEFSMDDTYEVPVKCLRPFLMLRTANDELAPWVPSTGDLFATDWLVFTDDAAGGDA